MKAKFSELVALNFQIDPKILEPHVPKGLELNFFKDETYVSLVAMMLRDVRVWGIPIHIATGFEEVNLRFYVRRKVPGGYRTGTCFLKDYVSGSAAAWILGSLFKSPFSRLKITHENSGFSGDSSEVPSVDYQWHVEDHLNRIRIKGRNKIKRTSDAETKVGFIIDSQNVYSAKDGVTLEYKVEHSAPWICWDAAQASFTCDVKPLFGHEFVKPLARRPASVFCARGSEVVIYRPSTLTGKKAK